jgi:sigma-B regulation protein RsbU (phosphoserine phosphatase)
MAIIDLNTGLVEYVNAGHNPPILRINDRYLFLDTKPNLILGSFAKSKYEKHTLQIHPGDKFFLYTDGVTEAEKDGGEQYSAQRLIKLLSTKKENNDKVIIQNVLDDIARFVQNHPQTDDITMLSFTYQGHVDRHTFLYKAEIMQAEKMFEDINEVMKKHQVPAATIDQVDVCAEEIFSNICIHGQVMDEDVRLILEITEKQISLTFFDKGKKFDPFKRVDPDIHLSAKERPIGGLGLFMVKKIMDNVKYSYQEKHNILVMTKYYKKGE